MNVLKTKRGHKEVIKVFCSFLIKGKLLESVFTLVPLK